MSDKARLPYVGVEDANKAPEPLPRRRPAAGPPDSVWPAPESAVPGQPDPLWPVPTPPVPVTPAAGELPRRPVPGSPQGPAGG